MAVVDRAEREVVPEFGVPLRGDGSVSVHIHSKVVSRRGSSVRIRLTVPCPKG